MIAHLWSRHRWLFLGFALALAATVFFAARTVMFALYWTDPAHRDEAIEGWMTPRYVAMSWQIPPEIVADAVGLDRDGSARRTTLADIAAARGVPVEALAAEIEVAVGRFRSDG